MNRTKKLIRNLIILVVMVFILILCSNVYLSPLSAHEHSERSIHYGPSQVIHIQDYEKGKYILCKYDKWVSCNTVNRTMFFFWSFGSQVTGFENKKSQVLDYTWSASDQYFKAYGIINDKRVKKVEIILTNGDVKTENKFYDNLFLIAWAGTKSGNSSFIKQVKGYDASNNIIFNSEIPS